MLDESLMIQLLEAVPDAFYIINADDLSLVVANNAAEEILARSWRHSCLSLTESTISCPSRDHFCPIEKALKTGLFSWAIHKIEDDDSSDYFKVHAYPMADASGDTQYIAIQLTNVTEQQENERKLNEKHRFEKFSSELASTLFRMTVDLIEVDFPSTLKQLADFSGADIAVIYAEDNEIIVSAEEEKRQAGKVLREETGNLQQELAMHSAITVEGGSRGSAIPVAFGMRTMLIVPFRTHAKTIGWLGLGAREPRDWVNQDKLLLKFTSEMFSGLMNKLRHEDELQRSRNQLKEMALHVQERVEQERAGIAREIHDELGQLLTALKFDVSWLKKNVPTEAFQLLEKTETMRAILDEAISSVQRISAELRPVILDDLGISAAIEWAVRDFSERTGIRHTMEVEEVTVNDAVSTVLYRICQEALTNIGRHSFATELELQLKQFDSTITLKIRDNGIGIPEERLTDSTSYGVLGMGERASFVGGKVNISGKTGGGTVVEVVVSAQGQEVSS